MDSPSQVRSTRSTSSSPSWFSASSLVSQEPEVLLETLEEEKPLQLVQLPPDSAELHGTCLLAAENHILHWKTHRVEARNLLTQHGLISCQ